VENDLTVLECENTPLLGSEVCGGVTYPISPSPPLTGIWNAKIVGKKLFPFKGLCPALISGCRETSTNPVLPN